MPGIPSFPGVSDSKESACSAGGPCLFPGSGSSLGEGNGYPLQYSCLENSMNREAWWATIFGTMWSQRATNTFTFSAPPYQSSCLFFSSVMICSLLPPPSFYFFSSPLSFLLFPLLLRYFVLSCPCVLEKGLRGTVSDPHGSLW